MKSMRAVIVPKSDQLNADSLLAGPLTITITDVEIRATPDQPVSIFYDGGLPYKPCKSMARVMVHCWGDDANHYVGRSMTLYCDPKVTWGGMAVGGIRISHMTHIDKPVTMALTATKGNKKPFVVKPLVLSAPIAPSAPVEDLEQLSADAQTAAAAGVAAYQAFWKQLGKGAREALLPQHETLKATAKSADDAALAAADDATDADGPVGDEMETV